MWIGVEEAVHKNLSQHRIRPAARDSSRVQIRRARRPDRGHLHAVKKLHRQYGGRGQRPADAWESHCLVAIELRSDAGDETPFPRQVLLAADGAGKFLHQRGQVVKRCVGDASIGELGEIGEYSKVRFDERPDVRPTHSCGDESAGPNLMNVGPSASRARRSRCARLRSGPASRRAANASIRRPVNVVLTVCRSGRTSTVHGVTGWSSK
jgi:hypothetical protein